jgi:hypothetical protein
MSRYVRLEKIAAVEHPVVPRRATRSRLATAKLTWGGQAAAEAYHDSDNFSTTSFRASTREQSSQRFLSGSIVSL